MGGTSRSFALAACLLASACASQASVAPTHTAPAPPQPKPESIARGTVPRFFPSYTTKCKQHETIKLVMQQEINPALSQISAALFHETGPEEERMQSVADAAATVLGCADEIARHGQHIHGDSWPTFDHFLHELVVNGHALQTSAMEDDPSVAIHWYYHFKQSCSACHARFVPR